MKAAVLVAGFAGHGKDTFSDLLAKAWGSDNTFRCAFAGPVKEAAAMLVGMPHAVAYGSQSVRAAWSAYGHDARWWLQVIGTELGRNQISQTVWLDRLSDRIIDLHQANDRRDITVVSDARFWNEIINFPKILREKIPGIVIKIVVIYRPQVPTLGAPPTFKNRLSAFLAGLPVIRHLLKLAGRKPVKVMHPSESGVWEMLERHKNGEEVFDAFVLNDVDGNEQLERSARLLISEINRALGSTAA